MGAGLPDFFTLTENIYGRLRENWLAYPAEAEGMLDRQHSAPDRTLFALQRRLKNGASRIRSALIDELETASNGTDTHHDLLRLSRNSLYPRIITTNFDNLFERAWHHREGQRIESWAAAGMPAPGTADFKGVFHLHGRLADTPLGLSQSDLVLNSAEFGDAYLRSGWASRYLYDLLRHAHVVIAGYSLNDPPTRYLFEALSADRERFEFRSLFALAPASPGEEAHVGALWEGRGAIPLLYDPVGGHTALRNTLAGWAAYAENPTRWARDEAERIFSDRFDRLSEDDWRRLDWVLSRSDAERILAEANPLPDWLASLLSRRTRRERHLSFGTWISERLGEPEMVTAVVQSPACIEEEAARQIHFALDRNTAAVPPVTRLVWRLLLKQCGAKRRHDNDVYSVLRRARAGDADPLVRRSLADALTPRPVLTEARRYPDGPAPPPGSIQELVELSFEPRDDISPEEVVGAWPPQHDEPLLITLEAALTASLLEAQEYGAARRSVFDLPSMAPHPQNEYRHGYAALVGCMVRLWERIAESEPERARRFSDRWRAGATEVEMRLWLHSLCFNNIYSGADVGTALLAASDQTFWDLRYRREVIRATTLRWMDIPVGKRERLEERIIGGDPR
jgi:hypothetical protein